ncbi:MULTISPECIES: (2Fe-2S) ferredoxin domain-containing protein [Pseudanabaena]|uniref:NADH dehydrogenase (Ubiquinone) 24 kDa subunit n=2 Tax=Pseudanabaena TaxID=1152 RepID=L8MTA2_9CYAN|nr:MULTISPECIES: (2Fe-2S) ferredoxin domain-containing protein [Pseudanabaena]ELS31182.1 NADH dehydrogenase (ubiquinone) 24 kDa subunit [Pseudanabaena biceps PCC 7429]MDG3496543.1 (2Fe-2S) ferredoxin domain-containing protein [Pseudanabaena catenata USMAC16]
MDIPARRVLVCQHRTCKKDGAPEILAILQQQKPINVTVEVCECLGLCGSGPMVLVLPDNIYYWHITPKKIQSIIETHLLGNDTIPNLMHPRLHPH